MRGNGFIDRTGEVHTNNNNEQFKIAYYRDAHNIEIEFEDGTVVKNKRFTEIKKGTVTNPNTPSFFGVGYIGVGRYKASIDRQYTKQGAVWKSILTRCHYKKELLRNPTYNNVSIIKEWHCFQNFAEWFEENYNPETMQGWHLDKDVLHKGNKIYSPQTCCFVPQEINKLFTKSEKTRGCCPIGVYKKKEKYISRISKNGESYYLGIFDTPEEAFQAYKTAKESYIKELADLWQGQITEPTYYAMYNYQVEITD